MKKIVNNSFILAAALVTAFTFGWTVLYALQQPAQAQPYGQGIAHRRIGQINNCMISEVHWQGKAYIVTSNIDPLYASADCAIIAK